LGFQISDFGAPRFEISGFGIINAALLGRFLLGWVADLGMHLENLRLSRRLDIDPKNPIFLATSGGLA
jgi:hypothetical protein